LAVAEAGRVGASWRDGLGRPVLNVFAAKFSSAARARRVRAATRDDGTPPLCIAVSGSWLADSIADDAQACRHGDDQTQQRRPAELSAPGDHDQRCRGRDDRRDEQVEQGMPHFGTPSAVVRTSAGAGRLDRDGLIVVCPQFSHM